MSFTPAITLEFLSSKIMGQTRAERPDLSGIRLPTPNVYWVTVTFFEGETHNLFMAADHPMSLVRKVSRHGAAHWGRRPLKGNCLIRSKRLDAIDLIHNPAAFEQARRTAAASGERDVVDGLDKIPSIIARHVGAQPIGRAIDHRQAAEALWASVGRELEAMGAPVRVLR